MEFLKSVGLFFLGVFKRLYYLIPSLLSDPFDVAERWFNVMFEPPEWLFWVLLSVGLLVAISLAYHEVRMQSVRFDESSKGTLLTLTKPKGRYLSSSHRITLWEIEQQMELVHRHSDHDGLEADIRDGVLVGDLMKRNCTRCGKPRNQEGDCVL